MELTSPPPLLTRPLKDALPHVQHTIEPRIKILSAGDMGVGKSCLIKRYCEERFVMKYISTIGVDYGVKRVNIQLNNGQLNIGIKVNFWDLAGHPSFFEVRNEFYKDTQGIVLVFSVASRKSFESLESWVDEASKFGAVEPVVVICGNKTDAGKRTVTEQEARNWAEARCYMYFETSANSGEGVTLMFEALFAKVIENSQKHR